MSSDASRIKERWPESSFSPALCSAWVSLTKSLHLSEPIWDGWAYKLLFCDSQEVERSGVDISLFQVIWPRVSLTRLLAVSSLQSIIQGPAEDAPSGSFLHFSPQRPCPCWRPGGLGMWHTLCDSTSSFLGICLCHLSSTKCEAFKNRDCHTSLYSLLYWKHCWSWNIFDLLGFTVILLLCVTLGHHEWSFLVAYAKEPHACSATVIAKHFYPVFLG